MNIRERPPLRLADEIVTPSGKHYRWGPDEADPANVPSRRRDSSTAPGGFESGDGTLPRQLGTDYADLERFSMHRRYGAGGDVAYEGRLERAPRVSGDQFSISPSSVGWQAHLDDDKSVALIGRDVDLSRWGPIPTDLRAALLATWTKIVDGSISEAPDSDGPALQLALEFSDTSRPMAIAAYDAGNARIGSVYGEWESSGNWTPPSSRVLDVILRDDALTVGDTAGDIEASSGSTSLSATTDTRRLAMVLWHWNAAATALNATNDIYWRTLAVYGNHGLTKRGTEPDAGFYDADLIGYAIDQWCPLLTYTNESLTADPFIIPQFAFPDPTTVGELVRQATRFSVRPWAVWEDRTFWLYDWGRKGRNWRARVTPSQLEETGPQVDRVWNSIMVAYRDVDGSTRTSGPPGSGADTEDSALVDDDPENPANKLGIIRRDMLTMGVGTAATAIEVGRRFLEESKRLDTSGRAVFNGYVEDDRGIVHPYWKVRAGDTVTFVDAGDTSARRIVRADNDHDARTSSVDLDSPPEGLQALLERLSVVLVPLGL